MHIIITTRADPALPIARLRARNQLNELRADDLRFTADEAAVFLNKAMGLKLSVDNIATLESRTEGWVAGLQLAALSMQGHHDVDSFIQAFSGSHRHVLTYLAEEVLERQSEGTLNFLLQTSVLDRLCGPLGDAVTTQQAGQATLEKLEHANLFIVPLDDQCQWYRYHHLFSEVLQSRLQQIQPDLIPELHRRASNWFEQNGLNAEAVEHALRGKDWAHATSLIEANMGNVQLRGEMATVLRWLGSLPDEAIHARPALGLAHAWLLVIVDDFKTAERRLTAAEQVLRADPALESGAQAALLGQVAAVREVNALMLDYPGEVTIGAGREALALLPEDDLGRRGFVLNIMGCAQYISLGEMQMAERSFEESIQISRVVGDTFTEMLSQAHLSQMRAIWGRLHAAEAPCEDLLRLAAQPGWEHVPAVGVSRVLRGRILYERNDLPGALEALTTGITAVEGYSLSRPTIIGCILLARVKLVLGDLDGARKLLERAWSTIQKKELRQITMPAAAYRARLLLSFGDLETAAEWAQEVEPTIGDPLNPALEYDHISLARVWFRQGRINEARQLLARLLPLAEESGRMGRVIEILALQVTISVAQGEEAEALAAVEQALALAEPEGYIRTFVDEGEPMREVIGNWRLVTGRSKNLTEVQTRLMAYAEKLLGAFPDHVSQLLIIA
ncbi:MAG TPA: helix-turn-helix transcriptional regulator, partial [Gammaproteobacteria bacterium]|nr:helix-turn-helix transcriptional regulator [Gammaproteobacteria bacterium]